MTNKKFIGGGFPGIRECIDEKNIMTKESREKREFSVRKIIPINLILLKNTPADKAKQNQNQTNLSEEFEIHNAVQYSDTNNFLHNAYSGNVVETNFDLNLINAPLKRDKKSKTKRSSSKRASSKRASSKRVSSKRA